MRENISYPDEAGRQRGFICPFLACRREHSIGDCSLDITLTKVVGVFRLELDRYRPFTSDTPLLLEEQLPPEHAEVVIASPSQTSSPAPRSRVLHGGRLLATFTFAEMGELAVGADVAYRSVVDDQEDTHRALDVAVFHQLKDATRNELDCQVCYNLLLDPATTACGHTFCRRCLQRVLDHSNLCPICRRALSNGPSSVQADAGNRTLADILTAFLPTQLIQRAEANANDDSFVPGSGAGQLLDTPIFVCTLSFPSMPTFLHVFEPRYRLMMRRAVESGSRTFGMVMYNRDGDVQGDLGPTEFVEYGTLLRILNLQLLPDGRSLVETVGVARFRVREWGVLDGYMVANVERVEDMAVADEERAEATETARAQAPTPTLTSNPTSTRAPAPAPAPPNDLSAQLDRLSTRALLDIGADFIARMRERSAPWLHERVLAAYGDQPNDPALFPFWFASLLPICDQEKYRLLSIRSVRERLKITALWIRRIEAQRWWVGNVFPDSDDPVASCTPPDVTPSVLSLPSEPEHDDVESGSNRVEQSQGEQPQG